MRELDDKEHDAARTENVAKYGEMDADGLRDEAAAALSTPSALDDEAAAAPPTTCTVDEIKDAAPPPTTPALLDEATVAAPTTCAVDGIKDTAGPSTTPVLHDESAATPPTTRAADDIEDAAAPPTTPAFGVRLRPTGRAHTDGGASSATRTGDGVGHVEGVPASERRESKFRGQWCGRALSCRGFAPMTFFLRSLIRVEDHSGLSNPYQFLPKSSSASETRKALRRRSAPALGQADDSDEVAQLRAQLAASMQEKQELLHRVGDLEVRAKCRR